MLLACLAAVTTPGCCTSSASSAKAASRTSATSLCMALTSVLNRPCFTASLMSCGHCLTSSRSSWKAFLQRQLPQSVTTEFNLPWTIYRGLRTDRLGLCTCRASGDYGTAGTGAQVPLLAGI